MEEKTDQYLTSSPQETQQLATDFARRLILDKGSTLKQARILALYGDLGGGKTTFVQGLAKGFDIKLRVISPTFVVVRQYKLGIKYKVFGIKYFYHIDLYRIDSLQNLAGLGLEEILDNKENIVAIEWAEKMADLLPKKRIDIKFEYVDEETRKIKVISK